MAVLAANDQILDLTDSGRSLILLIYARNSMGPRTEPCGTHEDPRMLSEFDAFNNTDWVLLSRKSFIQFYSEYSHLCR